MPQPFCLKSAKYCLLTYPQVPEQEDETFADAARELFTSERIAALYVIGRELHADGGVHFHCFLDFGRQFSSRDTRIFDIRGQHPNILRVGRTPRRSYDYAIKDGDIRGQSEGYLGPPDTPRREQGERSSDWATIVSAETRDDFFELVRSLQPRALACSFVSLARYADWRFRPTPTPYQHPEDWSFRLDRYQVLLDWAEENINSTQDRYVIFCIARPQARGARAPAAARVKA